MPYANKDKRREYMKEYYARKKENWSEYNNNRDKDARKEYSKEYYKKNKDKWGNSWDKIKDDPEKREQYNNNRRGTGKSTEHSRKRRDKVRELLGGKCVRCGATENLEVNHKDLADTYDRRRSNKRCSPGPQDIINGNANVELLCKSCHKKWSIAQRKAAIDLLSQLSEEEQRLLTEKHIMP